MFAKSDNKFKMDPVFFLNCCIGGYLLIGAVFLVLSCLALTGVVAGTAGYTIVGSALFFGATGFFLWAKKQVSTPDTSNSEQLPENTAITPQ